MTENLKELIKNRRVLVLVGPTGIGKTKLSLLIAEKLPVEIVSADSRQIYKYLNVGTAKPEKTELKQVPHHLIDFLRPDEYFSAGKFSKIGRKIIEQIFSRNRIPVVVGGSGLYVRALVDGLAELDIHDKKIRNSLRKRLVEEGPEALHKDLQHCDPKLAEKTKPTDKQRILRGLEVCLSTGMKLSKLQEKSGEKADFNAVFFGLKMERKKLYERINNRVDEMMGKGLVIEVVNLLKKGYGADINSMNTLGYKEVALYLNKQMSYEEMLKTVKQNTRRYAKRQLTWFRADDRIKWYEIKQEEDYHKLADFIIKNLIK